jgi:DNA-binding protein HU-beta
VSLSGFGKFKVKDNPAREGRNPANGETIQIAASRKLAFVPAKAVKDALNA